MNEEIRETIHSLEYDEYYASLDEKTKAKYDYVEMIIKTQYVVNKKFVKNLEETEFYEARVSLGNNEYRTIIFAVETSSFVESKRVLFLNSFLKKDTKQYKGEIETARRILKKYIYEDKDMIKLDEKKLAQLKTGSQHFDEKYGPAGSPSRVEFEAKAKAWYYAELLRDERKRQKLTQQELGERIGKKREYISSLEQGKTDMQLSTFMLIARALGLRFSLVVG